MLVLVHVPTAVGTDQHARELCIALSDASTTPACEADSPGLLHTRRQQTLSPCPTSYRLSDALPNSTGTDCGEACLAALLVCPLRPLQAGLGSAPSTVLAVSVAPVSLGSRPRSVASSLPHADRAAAGGIPPLTLLPPAA